MCGTDSEICLNYNRIDRNLQHKCSVFCVLPLPPNLLELELHLQPIDLCRVLQTIGYRESLSRCCDNGKMQNTEHS